MVYMIVVCEVIKSTEKHGTKAEQELNMFIRPLALGITQETRRDYMIHMISIC